MPIDVIEIGLLDPGPIEEQPREVSIEKAVNMTDMEKRSVLFVCVQNSARSQMAEAWTNDLCGEFLEAHSAGLDPGVLNPLAVDAMREVGIDIAGKRTQGVFDLYRSGARFHYVVTVCDAASAERCPVFPGVAARLQWSFEDPAAFSGTDAERLARTRVVRDAIKAQIEQWCLTVCVPASV